MNQTYSIEQSSIELPKSAASPQAPPPPLLHLDSRLVTTDRLKCHQEQNLFKKRHELKSKLKTMRKRAESLLKNHSWRKYFATVDDGDEEEEEESFEFNSVCSEQEQASSLFTDSSFVSTCDIPPHQLSKLNYYSENNNNKEFSYSFSPSVAPFSTSEMLRAMSNSSMGEEVGPAAVMALTQSKHHFYVF